MEADRSLFLLLLFREQHAFESSCELLLNYNGILLQGGGPSITLRKKKKEDSMVVSFSAHEQETAL